MVPWLELVADDDSDMGQITDAMDSLRLQSYDVTARQSESEASDVFMSCEGEEDKEWNFIHATSTPLLLQR